MRDTCYTCNATGRASQGWSGNPPLDDGICPDCAGTGIDMTPYGTGSDHCAWCGADWKEPHGLECQART